MPARTEALLRLTEEAIELLKAQRASAVSAEEALCALLAELEAQQREEQAGG